MTTSAKKTKMDYPSSLLLFIEKLEKMHSFHSFRIKKIIMDVTTNKYDFCLERYDLLHYINSSYPTSVIEIMNELHNLYYSVNLEYEEKAYTYIDEGNIKLAKLYVIEIYKIIYYVHSHIIGTNYVECISGIEYENEYTNVKKTKLKMELNVYLTWQQDNIQYILSNLFGANDTDIREEKTNTLSNLIKCVYSMFTSSELELIRETKQLLVSCYMENMKILRYLNDTKTKFETYKFNEIICNHLFLEKNGNRYLFTEELMKNRFHPKNIYKFNSWGFECGICDDEDTYGNYSV